MATTGRFVSIPNGNGDIITSFPTACQPPNFISMVRCDLCNNNNNGNFDLLYIKSEHKIVKCRNCGLVFVNGLPSQAELNAKYNKNIISPSWYYRDNEDDDYKTFKSRIKTIQKYARPSKLLDLGCATGTFMRAAKDLGFEVYGVDVNRQSIKYAKSNGLRVFYGGMPQKYANGFDVVVMNDFLEHALSPSNTIKLAYDSLNTGGLLYVVAPDIGSVMHSIFKIDWLHLKPDEHLYYFNKSTISKLLGWNDFEIISIKHVGRVRNGKVLAMKLGNYNKFVSNMFNKLPNNLLDFSINLNLFDEMEIIAQKRGD